MQAFLLALREGAAYDSPNYRWFAERYARFLYIDQVVVSAGHQGHHLYEDLFSYARQAGAGCVTFKFDADPPNEPSRRFHRHYGFQEAGSQLVASGTKRVSLQLAPL